MNPRVSILMPAYNAAPYLREAVDSIMGQSFQDFELIVLDDASTDGSVSILNSYSDSRIVRYTSNKNIGLANILNIGIDMARGEYIARMDADDISLPTRLQTEVEYLDSHPKIDLVSCGMQQFGLSGRTMSYKESFWLVCYNAFFFSPILHASSMWRKKSFESKNLHYRQERVPSEDYDLWVRALCKGLKLINIPDVLYRYRIHGNQNTTNQDLCRQMDEEIQKEYWRDFPYWYSICWWLYALRHHWFKHKKRLKE